MLLIGQPSLKPVWKTSSDNMKQAEIVKVVFENNMIAFGKQNDQEFAEYVFELRERYNTTVKETEKIKNVFYSIDKIKV
jgi:hypothetical protein